MSLRNTVLKGLSIAIVALGVTLGVLDATAPAAQAQSCRSSSYLPTTGVIALQNVSGTTIYLQRGNYNFKPTVHVWVNGSYAGQYNIPNAFFGGQIKVLFRLQLRTETWLGKVRQVYKEVPYVTVCGAWYGYLP